MINVIKKKKYHDILKGCVLGLSVQETLSLGEILERIPELYKILVPMTSWKHNIPGKGNKT